MGRRGGRRRHGDCGGHGEELAGNPTSGIGPFLAGKSAATVPAGGDVFGRGRITLSTGEIHTVKPLEVQIPRGRLTVVTGVSGSGKTTMVLESLVPALEALTLGRRMPDHVHAIQAEGVEHVKLIDATPIGINIRSTVATYANVHDELRKLFARTPDAKARDCGPGIFPTIRGPCGARCATEPAPSVWMCSFCPMWKSPVRTAAVRATPERLGVLFSRTGRGSPARFRSSWIWM